MSGGATTDDAVSITRCGPHVLIAIADGAGDPRATRSAEGAQRAVATAAAAANRSWSIYGADTQLLYEAMAAARIDLVGRAAADRIDPAAYACTLLLVLLAGERIVAARIGDGSMYTWDGKRIARLCSAPLPGSATPVLVQEDWRNWTATEVVERDFIQGVALCSDGCDEFFLADGTRRDSCVPTPMMFETLAKFCDEYGPGAGIGFITRMLNDPAWAKVTSDDRSLAMAIKPQTAKARPPVPVARAKP